MTRMVRFRKDMAPYKAGEDRAIPDDALAAKLVDDGDAEIIPSIFDTQRAEQARPAKTYQTRKGR